MSGQSQYDSAFLRGRPELLTEAEVRALDAREFAALQRAMERKLRHRPMPRGHVILLLAVLAWLAALLIVLAAWQMLAVLS